MELANFLGRAKNTISVDQLLRNQLMWMLLLRIILYTLLLSLSYIFRDAHFGVYILPANLLFLLLLVIYLATIFSAFYLLIYPGELRKFGMVQTLLDTFFVTLLVFFSGSSNSIFTTVYFFPIVAGGLIIPRKGGLLAAAAATIQYGSLLLLEAHGLYPSYLREYISFTPAPVTVLLNHFAVHGLTFFLAAILSALFGMRLQRTESALTDSLKNYDRLAILYKQIFDNISTGILTINNNMTITSANNAIGKITGLQPWSLIGRHLDAVIPNLDFSHENSRNTIDFTKDDGNTVRIGYAHMTIAEATADSKERPPRSKIITLQDISEIEKLERQVRQSEKLAAIGVMSASIAHDFRNPLTAISGSAQVLAADLLKEGNKSYVNYELTNIILREANRMIETIGEFLKFSRPEHANCNWFSLRGCLREVLQVGKADPAWPAAAEILFEFDGNIDVWADEKQMFTVFNHLIQNALPFCPPGNERITIRSNETKDDEGREYLEISIGDNGSGVGPENREMIFEPFYTTRPDGTGLGLAIVRQTIEEHSGSITLGSSDDGGALFTIRLPLPPS